MLLLRAGRLAEALLSGSQSALSLHLQAAVPAVAAAAVGSGAAALAAAAAHPPLPPLLAQRAATHSAAGPRPSPAADADALGSYYRTPYNTPSLDDWDVGQRRFTGRLETAIEAALLADAVVREQLVERLGFTVHRVRLAGGRRVAHILWDAHPGAAGACEAALQRLAFRLRRHVGKVMKSKFTPYLDFRHDHLPPRQACAAAAIERVEREAAAEEARGSGRGAGGYGSSSSSSSSMGPSSSSSSSSSEARHAAAAAAHVQDPEVLEAAIEELEGRMLPRRRYARRRGDPMAADEEEAWGVEQEGSGSGGGNSAGRQDAW